MKLRLSRYQTRHEAFESDLALENLAASIRTLGLLELPKVRPLPEDSGYFEIITGHRRIRAATQYLSWNEIKCEVLEDIGEAETFQLALAENVHRTNLHPYEEGQAYLLCEKLFGLSDEEISKQLHKPRTSVTTRRELAADANEYLSSSSDRSISNLFLQNFNLRHRKIIKRLRNKQNVSGVVRLIAEGASIREIRIFVERCNRPQSESFDYESMIRQQVEEESEGGFSNEILSKVHELLLETPLEQRPKLQELERLIGALIAEGSSPGYESIVGGFDGSPVKNFICPNCHENFDVTRRLDNKKDSIIFSVTPKDRKLGKSSRTIVYPRLR